MSSALSEFLDAYPVVIDLPVQWGEMDAFNHVNNVIYFRYFESARLAYMEQTHIMEDMKSEQVGPILASIEAKYKRPLYFPDQIKVGSRIGQIGEQDLIQEYAVFSSAQGAITTTGHGRIVMVDYKSHKKVAVSDKIKQAVIKLQPQLAT